MGQRGNSCFFNFLFCIGIQSINNVVTVSGVWGRDSDIHRHVSFLPQPPSHPGCHIMLSRVPCAIYAKFMLVIHFKYSSVYMSISNSLPKGSSYLRDLPLSVFVCSGYCNKVPHTGRLQRQKCIFSSSGGWKSSIEG